MKYLYLTLGTAAVVLLALIVFKGDVQTFGGANNSAAFFQSTGTTNGTSTINTTSTQVFPAGWTNFAGIWNPTTATISCYLDGKTAASSSVASGSGIIIGQSATSTFSGEPSVCFGPLAKCANTISYVGPVNCLASAKVTVGTVSN